MCDQSRLKNTASAHRNLLISHVKKQGWRFTHSDVDGLHFICRSYGCMERICAPLDTSPSDAQPCGSYHISRYGGNALLEYKVLVTQLVERRKALGLSQEDITACAGLGDGHINKIESFARFARFGTLCLLAETLGFEITLAPAALSDSARELIDRKSANKQTEITNE